MIGLDTGFFVELLRGHAEAIRVWKSMIEDGEEGAVSCLTLFELDRLALKGVIKDGGILLEAIPAVCMIIWIEQAQTLSLAARFSHALGIPTIDSLILSGFVEVGVETIYTTDRHLEAYSKSDLTIVNLRR